MLEGLAVRLRRLREAFMRKHLGRNEAKYRSPLFSVFAQFLGLLKLPTQPKMPQW